jgi:NTP pyrophosphatase (non-canonical NTP hydrolase)
MNKTIGELQKYIKKINVERGFEGTTIPELFVYLMEELGEMAKETRRIRKMHVESNDKVLDVGEQKVELGHEMADVLSYLLDLANRFDVDLEKSFWEKEEINNKRIWGKKN